MEKNIDNQIINTGDEIEGFVPTRRSRTGDKREADSRASNCRPAMSFETSSQYNLPESMLNNPVKQHGWSPYTIRNEQIEQNFELSLNTGWEVGEASTYPQMKRIYKHDPSRNRSHDDEMIVRGGQIFMDRELEIKKAEDQHYDEKNYHDKKLTDMHLNPGSGLRVISQSRRRGY